jgi:hypothetical protein
MKRKIKTEEEGDFSVYTENFEDRKEDIHAKETNKNQKGSQSPCETWYYWEGTD